MFPSEQARNIALDATNRYDALHDIMCGIHTRLTHCPVIQDLPRWQKNDVVHRYIARWFDFCPLWNSRMGVRGAGRTSCMLSSNAYRRRTSCGSCNASSSPSNIGSIMDSIDRSNASGYLIIEENHNDNECKVIHI